MASSTITIETRTKEKNSKKILIELDANQFERLAADLGLFSPEFLKSLDRAESDYKAGKIRKVRSLRTLRKK